MRAFFGLLLLGGLLAVRAAAEEPLSAEDEELIRSFEDPVWLAQQEEDAARMFAARAAHKQNPDNKYHEFPEAATRHRQKRDVITAQCPVGYTGLFCESPICNTTGKIMETSDAKIKTVVEKQWSNACGEDVTIFVDSHIQILVVDITSANGGRPAGVLFNSGNNTVVPYRKTLQQKARSNHGTGVFRFSTASASDDDCLVVASSQTSLVLYGGFVDSIFSDKTQEDPPDLTSVQKYPMQLVANSFAFTVKNLSYGESVNVVSFHAGDDGSLQYPPLPVGNRYNCAAGSWAGEYICLDPASTYFLKVRGLDNTGAIWQRIYTFECAGNPIIPDPTTPAPPPVNVCQNGGTIVQLRNQKVCACAPHFTGRICETKLCSNGGTLDNENTCQCPSDVYGGDFCEHITCKTRANDLNPTDKRGLVFVIRAHTNDTVRQQIALAANRIINFFDDTKPGSFEKFVFLLFINGQIVKHFQTDKPDKFLGAFERYKDLWQDSDDCEDSVFGALDTMFIADAIKNYKKSPVFLFTDALPNDDISIIQDVVNQLSEYKSPIFTILYEEPGCKFGQRDNGYDGLRRISRFTNGLVVKVPSTDGVSITNAAYFLAQGVFNTNLLTGNDLLDSCQYSPAEQIFFVDETVQAVTVAGIGAALRIRLLDTNDNTIDAEQHFLTLDKGHYRLTVDSNGQNAPCHYRVYAQSHYEAFFGATESIGQDRSLAQPIYNQVAHLVGVVTRADYPDPENIQAEIVIWDNDNSDQQDQRRLLYASNGVYRDGCTYNLYFGSWTCKNQYRPFYVNIYVTDSTGFTVMRTTSGHCAISATYPSTGCLNGGVPYKSTCICPGGWTGDRCEKAVCMNDGTPRGAYCECPSTFGGLHCEQSKCIAQNLDVKFEQKGITVSLIVQRSSMSTTPLLAIKRVLPTVLGDLQSAASDWVHGYTLWDFDNTSASLVTRLSNPALLDGELQLWVDESRQFDKTCSGQKVIDALILALTDQDASKNQQVFLYVYGGMDLESDTTNLQRVYELIDQLDAKIHVIQAPQNTCFKNDAQEMLALAGLSEYSGGHYSLSRNGETFLALPLQYKTNQVYEEQRTSCSGPQTFYFPVASEAQSVSMVIRAEVLPPVTFTSPDGSSLDPIQVYWGQTDSMYVAMRPCNDGWNLQGQYCFRTSQGNKRTWDEARRTCMNDGGILATIEKADVYTYIQGLLGGFDGWVGANDKKTKNTWVWDRGNDADLPVRSPKRIPNLSVIACRFHYTQVWKAGEPQQANGDCGLLGKDGLYAAPCTTKRDFVCVVHAYNLNYNPGSQSEGHLARGIWQVSYTPFDEPPADCGIRVDIQSSTQLFRRFDTVPFTDDGEGSALLEYPNNYQMIHVSSSLEQYTEQSYLEYAQFSRRKSQDISFASPIWPRDSCTYEYVTEAFYPDQLSYQVVYTGYDAAGYPFQRLQPMMALSDELTCQNGGVKPASDNRCVCPPDFKGKECDTPLCYTGKLNAAQTVCECDAPNYAGDHCQFPNCTRGTNDGPPPTKQIDKTFGLIVDGSVTGNNAAFVNGLSGIMDTVFSKVPGGALSSWFTSFIGQVAFDAGNNGQYILQNNIVASNKADFVTQMTSALSNQYQSQTRARSFMKALYRLLADTNLKPDSPIFIVTDSAVEDWDAFNSEIRDNIARTHAQIHVYVLDDSQGPGGADYRDKSVTPLLTIPFSTGGGFYQVPGASKLGGFWSNQLKSLYKGYLADHSYYTRCSDKVEYFQVGGEDTSITFDVFSGGDQNMTVIDQNGLKYPISTASLSHTKTNYLWTIDLSTIGSSPGVWQLAIDHKNKPTACMLAIRINRDDTPAVGFNPDVGEDRGHHSDGAQLAPESGPNSIIAYAKTDTLRWVNVYDRDTSRLTFSSPLVLRTDECTWNYVSVDLFTCVSPYHVVAVEGYDSIGHPFRRIYKTHCLNFEQNSGAYVAQLPTTFFEAMKESPAPTDEELEQEREVRDRMAEYY
ncbi:hypothetical protein M3Y99_01810300 [Aphelenchoides fujianensis]|nr:hypothetical protein M3Y99_01810300 [Aphelenchoides fujianensis]